MREGRKGLNGGFFWFGWFVFWREERLKEKDIKGKGENGKSVERRKDGKHKRGD